MNISLNNLAYDSLEMYRANLKDSDSVDIRQVYFWVNSIRAYLLNQRLSKNIFNIYEEEIQSIDNVSLAASSVTGTVQSSIVIPSTINRRGYPGTITRVSNPSSSADTGFNTYPVQVVTYNRFNRVGNRKFNSGLYYATIGKDKKLYYKTHTVGALDRLSISGVFQNPIEVMILNGDSDPYNSDYPLNMSMVKPIINLVNDEHLGLVLKQTEDKIEDGRDSTTQ